MVHVRTWTGESDIRGGRSARALTASWAISSCRCASLGAQSAQLSAIAHGAGLALAPGRSTTSRLPQLLPVPGPWIWLFGG